MLKLSNVPFKLGQANGSGIGKYLYCIAADDLAAWPTITDNLDDAVADSGYIGYTGNFTLKPGAKWIRIYNTQGEGTMSAEPTGERDSKMFNNKLSFRYPKLTDASTKLADAVVNGDCVFVGWHDGAYRVVGDKHYRCDVTPNVTSGDGAGSSKGITFEAECPGYKALPIYSGNIELEDGTLNCATDEFTPSSTTYTVTYDGNGNTSGTAPTDSSSPYNSGSTVTVLGNTGTLAKTGKTFGGWNTKADGTGTDYAAADTFTINANTTLYAKWTD